MTEQEQDKIIAKMVHDRRALIKKVACLEAALEKASENLHAAQISAVRASMRHNAEPDLAPDYPHMEILNDWINEVQAARKRLDELSQKIDGI